MTNQFDLALICINLPCAWLEWSLHLRNGPLIHCSDSVNQTYDLSGRMTQTFWTLSNLNKPLICDTHENTPIVQWWVQDDVIKWKHFPRHWPFVRGFHLSPLNSPHKDQWCGALMFSLICAWIEDCVNNRKAGDLRRRHSTHYDVIVMWHATWTDTPSTVIPRNVEHLRSCSEYHLIRQFISF